MFWTRLRSSRPRNYFNVVNFCQWKMLHWECAISFVADGKQELSSKTTKWVKFRIGSIAIQKPFLASANKRLNIIFKISHLFDFIDYIRLTNIYFCLHSITSIVKESRTYAIKNVLDENKNRVGPWRTLALM